MIYLIRGVFEIAIFLFVILFVLYALYFIFAIFGFGFANYIKMVIDRAHDLLLKPVRALMNLIPKKEQTKKKKRRTRKKKFKKVTEVVIDD